MRSLGTRAGGRHEAHERGAFSIPPQPATPPDECGPESTVLRPVPLFPLRWIARVDWASIVSAFPSWRFGACN
jgi:hypothetical protein